MTKTCVGADENINKLLMTFPSCLSFYSGLFIDLSSYLAVAHFRCFYLPFLGLRLCAESAETQTIFRCLHSFIFLHHCVAMAMVGREGRRKPERKDDGQLWRPMALTGDCSW